MPDSHYDSTVAYVKRVIFNHAWTDPTDWVDGLDKLSALSDAQIESIASTSGPLLPIPLEPSPPPRLLTLSDAPDLSYEQLASCTLLRLKNLDRKDALAEVLS